MMRMSFGLTEAQFVDRTKDVTRRLGWRNARVGQRVRGVQKAMGLKKGEKSHELGVIEFTEVSRERLDAITEDEVRREGFPGKSRGWFIEMFCAAMGCRPDTEVTRIAFVHVDEESA